MKSLLIDIETAPNLAHVWGLWDQTVGLSQLLESGYVLCFAAKWHGEREIMFDSVMKSKPLAMLKRAHALLDEADVVIHYNGRSFDIPTLNKEFVQHELAPPAPYKQVDLLQVVKRQFRFPSNKLDYVCGKLGIGRKVKHAGHEMWIRCMARDPAAWKVMEKYNKQDVRVLERLHDRLLPWITGYPNRGLYDDSGLACPKCGSNHLQRRGESRTVHSVYARYQCNDCGSWMRSEQRERRKVPMRHAA
jgi:hypothetical protein